MPEARLEMRCSEHPAYRAIRKQRVECPACDKLYEMQRKDGEPEPGFWTKFWLWIYPEG